jgi:predicted hydrolase (HD superfamily)
VLYPFYLSKHHPRLGANIAREHGASPEVVRLIAEHQHYPATDEVLRRLQAADNKS